MSKNSPLVGKSEDMHIHPEEGASMEGATPFRHSVYAVNLLAFIPRHWFVYLIGIVFPFLTYINLDFKPNADDSGKYFMFWLLGISYTAYGLGFLASDLMNKPHFFCMPKQQGVLRHLILGIGCLITFIFYFLAVFPKYSYWAPQTVLGELLLLPIGFLLFGLVVYMTIRNNFYSSWVLMGVAFSSILIMEVYFHGSGADIARPPTFIFPVLAAVSLMVLPWLWVALGRISLRRGLIGTETLSSHTEDDFGLGSFCAFQRSSEIDDSEISGPKPGSWFLSKLEKASSDGKDGLVLNFLYHLRRSKDPLSFFVAWSLFVVLAVFLAAKVVNEFNPVIFFYLMTLFAMFQGGVLFKGASSPMLPWGRRRLFANNLLNAGSRFGFLILLFALVNGLAQGVMYFWSDMEVATPFSHIRHMPMVGYVYCLCMAPFMLYLFHRSRKPSWLLFTLIFCWIFGSPPIFEKFSGLSMVTIIIVAVAAWVPFLALCFRRNFTQDLT